MKYLILISLFTGLAQAQDYLYPGYYEDDFYRNDVPHEQYVDQSNSHAPVHEKPVQSYPSQETTQPQGPLRSQVRNTPDYTIPVGFYTNGSIRNAQSLPAEGEGFMRLFVYTDRGWGAGSTVKTIIDTAAYMSRRFPGRDRLQVEDLGAQHGGKISGHGSHQNGLDADLEYFKVNGVEHSPEMTGRTYAASMVAGNSISANFDVERNWELAKALHTYGQVQRIFMDKIIKKSLCNYAKSIGEYKANIKVLASIRHVTNHHDHLHFRMRCPKGSNQCRAQADVGAGSGCP